MADFRPNSVRTPHVSCAPWRASRTFSARPGVLHTFVHILVGFARLEGVLSRETDEDLYKDDGLAGLRQSCEKRLTVTASVVFEGFLGGDGDAWMSWDNAANGLLCFRDGGAYGPCSKQRSRPTPAFRRALSFVSWDNRRTVPRCFAPSHASRRGDQASAGRVRALGILERPARKGASPARHARSAEAPSRLGVLRVFRRPCAWPASRVSRDWSVASRLELGVPPFASEGRALACCGRRSPCDDAGDSRHVI